MRKLIGATLSFTALVLGACGGAAQPAATSAPTQAAASAAATTAATAAPTTAPTAAATQDQDKALIDLLRARTAQYKVTYDFTISSTPGQKQTLTQYFKAPNFRQDITVTTDGKTETVITILNAQGSFTCSTQFGGGSPGCVNFGAALGGAGRPGGAPGAGSGPQGAPTDLAGYNLLFTSTKNVAGQTARCYSFTGAQTGGVEVVGCYSAQGIPLYMSSKSAQFSSEMTATQLSTTVADSDFNLPYPVVQIPGFPVPTRP